jgi:hypothetical protein
MPFQYHRFRDFLQKSCDSRDRPKAVIDDTNQMAQIIPQRVFAVLLRPRRFAKILAGERQSPFTAA